MNNSNFNPYEAKDKGRISIIQFVFLAVTLVIATADVFLPAFVAQEAKQDSWISVILGTITSLVFVNMFITLGLKYPEKTLIQYSCDILGKPLGKLVGLLYIYYFLFIAWMVSRELGEIFVTAFNPSAPVLVFSITVIIVAAYAILSGLEVIARVNEILIPSGIGVLMFIALINVPNMDFKNFLPIMYNGFYPAVKGAILIQAWQLETVILLQFVPFIKDKDKIRKGVSASIIILGLSLGVGVLTIATFGSLTGKLLFPALEYVRIASLGTYIQNLDISIMIVWIAGIFIKIAISYYAAVLSISQYLGLKSYKQVIIPVGVLIICFSMATTKMLVDFIHSLHYIFPFLSFTMGAVIPGILLLVSVVKANLQVRATFKGITFYYNIHNN